MSKIADKFAELSQRALELEAQITRQARQDAFVEETSRRHRGSPDAVGRMQKRLTSLKRSCEILARHLTPESQDVKRPALPTFIGAQS